MLPRLISEFNPTPTPTPYRLAIRHHCDILVTGDRTHFGQLYGKTIQGVSVLSPAMLAETVLG